MMVIINGFLIFLNDKSSFFKLLIDINLAENISKKTKRNENVAVCSFFNLLFDFKPFPPY